MMLLSGMLSLILPAGWCHQLASCILGGPGQGCREHVMWADRVTGWAVSSRCYLGAPATARVHRERGSVSVVWPAGSLT